MSPQFRCPACRAALENGEHELRCAGCGTVYPVDSGVPVLKDPSRGLAGEHFDHVSEHYDHSLPAHVVEHYLERRTRVIRSILPAGSVLDVGCGTGVLLERLDGYDQTGIDASVGMLRVMRKRTDIRCAAADADRLPFEDGAFDLVYSVAVLHHLEDPVLVRHSIEEMWRVVAPGGHVLIWDHNPLNPYWPLLMRRVPQDVGTERLVPLREIRPVLERLGGRVDARRMGFVPDFVPLRALPFAAGAERVLERVPGVREFAAHNVVLARKPS